MRHLRLIIISLSFFTVAFVNAQSDESDTLDFSLDRAVEFAVENNLTAKNARLDISSAEKQIWETAASGLPQVNASATYNNNLSLATTLIPDFFNDPTDKIEVQFGTKHYATGGLSASQMIFSGQYIIGIKTSQIYRDFSEKNLERTEQDVSEAVIQNYYLVLMADTSLSALKGNYNNMQKIYNETEQMYEAGFVEENDLDQIEITLTDLENAVLSMERQLTATRNLLKYQMGLDLNKHIELTDDLESLVSTLNYQLIMNNNLEIEENINYQILDYQEQLALMDLKAKRTEFLPNLSAFFSLDYTAQRDEFNLFSSEEDWYKASAVGLSLNLPVFSSGMRMAGVARKRIAYEKAQNDKRFAAEGLRVEYMQARYDLANAYQQYLREQKNLELTRKVVSNTQIKFSEGVSSSLEMTQVNDQYLQTLNNYLAAMVDLLNAKMKLEVLLNKI